MLSFMLLLLAGVTFALMVSMNGQLAAYLNIYEVSLLVHLIGAGVLLVWQLLVRRQRIRLGGAPWYVYLVGFIGVALVSLGSYVSFAIGAASMLTLSLVGQLVISAIIDHFGWFGVPVVRFRANRLLAYGVILAGLGLLIYY